MRVESCGFTKRALGWGNRVARSTLCGRAWDMLTAITSFQRLSTANQIFSHAMKRCSRWGCYVCGVYWLLLETERQRREWLKKQSCNSEQSRVEGNWDTMHNYSAISVVRSSVGSASVAIQRVSPPRPLTFSPFLHASALLKSSRSESYYKCRILRNRIQLYHVNSSDTLRRPYFLRAPTILKPIPLKMICSLQIPEDQGTRRKQPTNSQHSYHTIEEALSTAKTVETLTETIKGLELTSDKPEICTADELHYISVPGTDWKLALWRYPPRSGAPVRNHPLLLLSGVGTNAIGFDLDPSVSMARFMAEQGFDTWILEVRGAGLSKREGQPPASQIASTSDGSVCDTDTKLIKGYVESQLNNGKNNGKTTKLTDVSSLSDSKVVTTLSNSVFQISERLRNFLVEGQSLLLSTPLLERISRVLDELQLSERYDEFRERLARVLNERQDSAIAKRIADLNESLLNLLEEGQRLVSPQLSDLQDRLINAPKIAELQEQLIVSIDDFQNLVNLLVTYDWDFDNYLEEDFPAAMEYICSQSKPQDGKIHAVGHSMGGIVLYAYLASKKENCGLVSAVTIASSLDYNVSDSSLKLLLPLADPAQALNVPAVPLGALMAAIHPLAMNPPYVLSWLTAQVSAQNMMDPELYKKLVLNNFCTIPAKLLLHLTSVFQPGGIHNRNGTIFYKDSIHLCKTPVLAVAGDKDLICPTAAVLDTVKALPEELVTYKLFGGENNQHYGHYDLVCGRMAKHEVFPCIQDFLVHHDNV